MAKIVVRCSTCGKPATSISHEEICGIHFYTYQCGHTEVKDGVVEAGDTLDITSLDGKRLFPFQLTGAQFAEKSGIRCLIADEMGLGKTPQSLATVKAHPELHPFLVLCKSGLRPQWTKEIIRWCGDEFVPQVITSARDRLYKGFKAYVVSLDMLRRFNPNNQKKRKKTAHDIAAMQAMGMKVNSEPEPMAPMTMADIQKNLKPNPFIEDMRNLGIKAVIIDECQLIKNVDSQRTRAVQDVCRELEHIVALSGTPIKNNAREYYPILNILRPDKIPSEAYYLRTWVDQYWDGYKMRTGGIKNPERFKEFTSDFIIRRTRAEVLPDLPKVFRTYQFCDLGEDVEKAYVETLHDFQDYYNSTDGSSSIEREGNILSYLSKMRHITGIAKIEPIVEFTEEFLRSTDRLLTIFVHHKDVGSTLFFRIQQICKAMQEENNGAPVTSVTQITSEMSPEARDEAATKFLAGEARVLIASTLASGEGLNLQACSDCIMAERQWNPANEEQAEGRFPRPGSTADKINATYFVAVGTVDEFFSELVERKREIVGKTLDGEAVKWDQSSLMRELAEQLMMKGGQKWGF